MPHIDTAFVLGAGLGTRLRPLTQNTPKPMLKIRGRPLIEIIFDALIGAGMRRIIVNTHHASEAYKAHFTENSYRGAELKFIHEPLLLDTGGALKNALPLFRDSGGILVYNGDILSDIKLADFLEKFEASAACAALVLRDGGPNKNVSVKGGFVCDMRFALKSDFDRLAQFTGVFAARGEFFRLLEQEEGQIFSTVDIFLKLIKKDPHSLLAHFDNSAWSDIGTLEEYERLK